MTKKKDDTITIDFKKITGILKGNKKKQIDNKTNNNDTIKFIKKHYVFLILLIPLFLAVFTRILPVYLPITNEWATNAVYSSIQNDVNKQINQQYPTLPAANKKTLIDSQFQQILENQGDQIDQQIKQTADYFKSQLQNDAGSTYLVAIDPYFYYRKAHNYFKHGFDEDIEKDGVYIDTKIYAGLPLDQRGGTPHKINHLNTVVMIGLHKVVKLFNPNADLMRTIFFIPIIIASLAVIPAFFIARKISGNVGGLFAGILVAIHPSFITRTAGGFSDTDAYNVTFPLFISWLFIESLEAKELKKKLTYSGLAGLLTGIFSFAWHGWWYITYFMIAAMAWYIIYWMIKEMKDGKSISQMIRSKIMKYAGINIIVLLATTVLGTILIKQSWRSVNILFTGPLKFITFKDVAVNTLWPNVFTTVAEQNSLSLVSVINQISVGSRILFVIALLGVFITLLSFSDIKKESILIGIAAVWYVAILNIKAVTSNVFVFLALMLVPILAKMVYSVINKEKGIDIKYAVFLIIWMVFTIWASTRGVRFLLLLVPAFSIAFGLGIGAFHRLVTRWISNELDVKKIITSTVLILLFALLLIKPIRAGYDTGLREIPSYNDAWDRVLNKINTESEPDAIINSWWDFGHWFESMADRPTTLDGGRQNNPQAHWLGKIMLTDNETVAVGILRMLDCGATMAFDKVNNYTENDVVQSIDILNDLFVLDKEEAKSYLLKKFSKEETEEVLQYTHCEPPEDFFITSEDMVSKSGVWAHFGAWDFRRSKMFNHAIKMNKADGTVFLIDEFGLNEKQADQYYYEIQTQDANNWIAPWPSYANRGSACHISSGEIICPMSQYHINFRIDPNTFEVSAKAPQGDIYPNSITYMEGTTLKEHVYTENAIGLSIALFEPTPGSYRFVAMDPKLAKSIFTRTFFFKGVGLKQFKLFTSATTVTGDQIYVWKIDWHPQEELNETEDLGNNSSDE